jgi:hypothetical protein
MRKIALLLAVTGLMLIAATGRGWAYSEADTNTRLGLTAGSNLTGSAYFNTFIGIQAGFATTNGSDNTIIGARAGKFNTTGYYNTFIGYCAGYTNTTGIANSFIGQGAGAGHATGDLNTFIGEGAGGFQTAGSRNTFLGSRAGASSSGDGNVFLGYYAGAYETSSNKLYIDTCLHGSSCNDPFIYGEFDNRILKLDGSLGIGVSPSYGVDVSGNGASRSQLHFTLDGTDTGGWITAAAENNFWLSSGAVWDSSAGGWVQKSSDGKAIMAGSGGAGYRVMTRTGCLVDTVCAPTARMTINYSGQVGFGVSPGYPLHMASGAHVTAGGVWISASSREYKEEIEELSPAAALEALASLNPVTFKYKTGEDERHVGFIAEDVPELVATRDRKGLSEMDIVAVLTRVLKEQQEINRELTKELADLEAQQKDDRELIKKLAALESEVKRLSATPRQ